MRRGPPIPSNRSGSDSPMDQGRVSSPRNTTTFIVLHRDRAGMAPARRWRSMSPHWEPIPVKSAPFDDANAFQPVEARLLRRTPGCRSAAPFAPTKHPGASAAGLLGSRGVGCRIGADEETAVARGRGATEREAVMLALGDGKTIEVRAQTALEQRRPG